MRLARETRGQMLVIVALGMVAIVAMVGLVVDGGYAWGQQRDTQNGTDAATHAAAVALLEEMVKKPDLTGPYPAPSTTDFYVWQKMSIAATENSIVVPDAEYTDWQGNLLGAKVGPSDGLAVPDNAAGVNAHGWKSIDLFLAPVIGINAFDINTEATVVAGNITGICDVPEGCALLPIAFPATMVTCTDNNQDSVPVVDPVTGQPLNWPKNQRVIMPLCGGNPGSVGWVDWSPPWGGTSETIDYVLHPPTLDIELPSWQFITSTGDINALPLENALNTYAGQIVLFPLFDSTCRSEPTNQFTSGCPSDDVGAVGQNQWYHLPAFAAFRFDYPKGAFINGGPVVNAICDTGNGATSCIVGTFIDYVGTGTVGPPDSTSSNFGVQLIK